MRHKRQWLSEVTPLPLFVYESITKNYIRFRHYLYILSHFFITSYRNSAQNLCYVSVISGAGDIYEQETIKHSIGLLFVN